MNRTARALTLIALAALLATGCGGGPPEISTIESCLKDLKLDVERSDTKQDPDVTEGLSARTKPTEREFTIALAATAKSDAKVKSFTKRFRETVDQMDAQQEAEFQFDSGSDGRYVWATTGTKDSKTYDDALACVKP